MDTDLERCMELYLQYGEREFSYLEDNTQTDGLVDWVDIQDNANYNMHLTPKALELIKGTT